LIEYKEFICPIANVVASVIRSTDNAIIPFDTANIDYQAYLKWLADGNVPEPADEQS
jgi:hypothetical protein